MPNATMIVTNLDSQSNAIYLSNNAARPPALCTVDIFRGPVGCATTGRIHATGSASVLVNPTKFNGLDNSLSDGDQIKLTFTVDADGNKNVTDIRISHDVSLQREAQQIGSQLTELARVIERDLSGNTLEQLQRLNTTMTKVLDVLAERERDPGSDNVKRIGSHS